MGVEVGIHRMSEKLNLCKNPNLVGGSACTFLAQISDNTRNCEKIDFVYACRNFAKGR